MGVKQMEWNKWTEGCQAVTSQATPPSEPQEISPSQSQILIQPASLRAFHAQMCKSTCACMHVCYLQTSQTVRVIYTGGKSGLQHSVFSHANISSITDDRALWGIDGCSAKRKLTHELFCVIPGIPLLGSWVLKTWAPGKPCHPRQYKYKYKKKGSVGNFYTLKENKWEL